IMFWGYQEREEYEDELYREDDSSSVSEVDSELEFRLYSQLHYSLNHEEEQQHELQQEQEQQGEQCQDQQGCIIISSGPEVITVSDSTDEDAGVCASKDKKLQLQVSVKKRHLYSQSSVPSSPEDQPQSRTAGQEIVISLDSDSDSDGLENWMILGQKKLDGDCCIQLNLEGTADSSAADHDNDDYNWSISAKDMKAQIANRGPGTRRLASRYYEKKNVTCRNCNKTGHLSKSCSTPKKLPSCLLCGTQGHLQRSCPHHFCSNCMLPGHGYEDCLEPAYWHKQCHRCSMTGHFQDSCPEVWRQYHLTTRVGPPVKPVTRDAPRSPAYCYNCSRKGHFGFECKDRRMFNGTYPTAPYISYYDTPKDIRYRNNRMKRKKRKKNRGGLCKEGKEGKERTPTANAKREQKQLQLQAKPWPEKRKERRQLKKLRKQSAAQQPGKKQQCPLQEEKDFPRGSLKKVKSGPKSTLKCKPDINLFSLFQERERKGKKRQAKARDRQAGAPTKEDRCPVDENLFLIKQRKKCKRKTSRN
uniref:Zinc finger CCHC domain-containing protein 7 n=1 Tax=Scleropages formosus TaxID=113540 RepID=A0A8C9RH75_SCLFO